MSNALIPPPWILVQELKLRLLAQRQFTQKDLESSFDRFGIVPEPYLASLVKFTGVEISVLLRSRCAFARLLPPWLTFLHKEWKKGTKQPYSPVYDTLFGHVIIANPKAWSNS